MLLHHNLGKQLERPAQLQADMAAIEQRLDVFAASDVAVQRNRSVPGMGLLAPYEIGRVQLANRRTAGLGWSSHSPLRLTAIESTHSSGIMSGPALTGQERATAVPECLPHSRRSPRAIS